MSVAVILILGAIRATTYPFNNQSIEASYTPLPRFWTNTGFSPASVIDSEDYMKTLLSNEVQTNIRYAASLPNEAIKIIRVHWLLQLLKFVQFTQSGVPIYDFTTLDIILDFLDDLNLYPVIEFMGNPGNVFEKNPIQNENYWSNMSYTIARRYSNMFGLRKVLKWRFESWNEPDILTYNKLNFTVEDYITYVYALRRGLTAAGQRPAQNVHFPLHGPAGLFKSIDSHPICWNIMQVCNDNPSNCPFDTLTYHRKGFGRASDVLESSSLLLKEIQLKFPNIAKLPVANDEADPIAYWSTPHDYLADVRYAATLISIVLLHWSAKLQRPEFKYLDYISHDNSFLSYHPYEFSQRTLLAHFRMNNSQPAYTQFVQKPVYAALGMLAKLATMATDLEFIDTPNNTQLQLLKTTVPAGEPLYLSWILLPAENATGWSTFTWRRCLPFELQAQQTYAYLIEILDQNRTNPAAVWQNYGSPAYPNATVRETLRRCQYPQLYATGLLKSNILEINFDSIELPWVLLLRVCSNLIPQLKQPQKLTINAITHNEVLITWRQANNNSDQCLKTYEVWHLMDGSKKWLHISKSWQLPYLSFHYAPTKNSVNGFYKVRSIDAFNRESQFSNPVEYIEI